MMLVLLIFNYLLILLGIKNLHLIGLMQEMNKKNYLGYLFFLFLTFLFFLLFLSRISLSVFMTKPGIFSEYVGVILYEVFYGNVYIINVISFFIAISLMLFILAIITYYITKEIKIDCKAMAWIGFIALINIPGYITYTFPTGDWIVCTTIFMILLYLLLLRLGKKAGKTKIYLCILSIVCVVEIALNRGINSIILFDLLVMIVESIILFALINSTKVFRVLFRYCFVVLYMIVLVFTNSTLSVHLIG